MDVNYEQLYCMAQLRKEDYLQWVKLIRWALKGIEPFLAKRFEEWEVWPKRDLERRVQHSAVILEKQESLKFLSGGC